MNYNPTIEPTEDQSVQADYSPLFEADEEERQSRRRLWIIGAVVLALLIGIGLWLARSGAGGGDAKKTDLAPVVTVVAPGKTTIEGTISANGTLAARREMPVGSVGEGGQVVSVLVEPGDWVVQGQVLAVVDRQVQVQQQASSSAQIGVAEADARLAQSNLDRGLKLVEKGFISKADIDRLTATRDAAVARVKVARAQFGELQARTARLNIVAPAAGLVLERRVEPGQVVGGGSGVLFRLAKGGEMELRALLSEVDLASIAPGVAAEVVPVGSDKSFTGQVWQIAPVIDPATRQGTARVALAYAPELRPGGFAAVTIRAGTVVAPMLPESALLSDSEGTYVYVVGKDNKVERRAIKQGRITDRGVVIVEGLNGTERIVLRAGGFLQPGEKIKPVTPKP